MIDPDRDLEMTLKLTRMLAEPSMADGARVLSAVRSELTAMPHVSTTQADARAAGGRATSHVRPRAAAAKPALQGAALHQLITVGVVAAALGFAAGWALRDPEPAPETPREVIAQLPPAPVPLPPREPSTPPEIAPEAPVASAEPEPAAPERAEPEPAAPAPKPRARRPTRKPAQHAAAKPEQDSSDFFEAVNLLRRAQRAVNRGDGQVALSLLSELDTRFDARTLGEERQATRALALCASSDEAGAQRIARELARVAPSSIYAGRLRLSCAGWYTATGEPEPRTTRAGAPEPGTEPPSP
jgi:hypothetical protein